MSRILTDFHHSSLMRAHWLLFKERLGFDIYRPIGLEWFTSGFWAINNQEDTAKQFLDIGSQPTDNTPPLNEVDTTDPDGVFLIDDPGGSSYHMACTLDYFKTHEFDFVIASIPAHVPLFEQLIKQYNPQAKLIVHMGNNWTLENYKGYNVLASIAPQFAPGVNVHFYHQEFDLDVFKNTQVEVNLNIYSFVNIIQSMGIGWDDFNQFKKKLEPYEYSLKAYGGQCPDGNMTGADELANKMREAQMIFHVKPGGDGFGHIIHNAYAVGRPVITRKSHYKGQLAEQLMTTENTIDLDVFGVDGAINIIKHISENPDELRKMGRAAHNQFANVVDYDHISEQVGIWLANL